MTPDIDNSQATASPENPTTTTETQTSNTTTTIPVSEDHSGADLMSQFNAVKCSPVMSPETVKSEVKIPEVKAITELAAPKPETKVADKASTELLVIDPFAQKPKIAQKAGTRDYADLDADVIPLFKQMNNDAFAKFKPLYLEHKNIKTELEVVKNQLQEKLKGGLPESYAENPQAYTLAPEYVETVQHINNLSTEANFWEQQLAKITAGEKANDLVRDAQGNYKLGNEVEPTAQNQAAIQRKLMQAQGYVEQMQQKAQFFAATHQERHKQVITGIKATEDKYFPHYKDPNNPHKEVIQKFLSNLPQAVRQGNPLASPLAKAYATMVELSRQLKEAQEGGNLQASIQEDAKKAGPTATKLGQAGSGKIEEDDIMSQFARLKSQE